MRFNSTAVALTSRTGYDSQSLTDNIDRVIAGLDRSGNFHSCKVLLKPNLITAKYGILPCTEPAFICSVARWFVDQGARVSIGDSPAFGSATAALQALGIADDLTAIGVRISDFRQSSNVSLSCGNKAAVAVDAMECDLLVNMPRVKAHAQTRVTLTVKNCFGCLVGLHKPWWHMVHGGKNGAFSDRLVQLLDVLADTVNLVDGIVAMEKTGPVHGVRYPLAVLGASTNPVAMDCALHEVLRVDPKQSPLMSACQRAEIRGAELSQLTFPLAAPAELQVSDFRFPDELNPIRFNPIRFLQSTFRRILSGRRQND
jgi:uncharacterized protein (DUF362 family)